MTKDEGENGNKVKGKKEKKHMEQNTYIKRFPLSAGIKKRKNSYMVVH